MHIEPCSLLGSLARRLREKQKTKQKASLASSNPSLLSLHILLRTGIVDMKRKANSAQPLIESQSDVAAIISYYDYLSHRDIRHLNRYPANAPKIFSLNKVRKGQLPQ